MERLESYNASFKEAIEKNTPVWHDLNYSENFSKEIYETIISIYSKHKLDDYVLFKDDVKGKIINIKIDYTKKDSETEYFFVYEFKVVRK